MKRGECIHGFDFTSSFFDFNDASVEIATFSSSNGKLGIILYVLGFILYIFWFLLEPSTWGYIQMEEMLDVVVQAKRILRLLLLVGFI